MSGCGWPSAANGRVGGWGSFFLRRGIENRLSPPLAMEAKEEEEVPPQSEFNMAGGGGVARLIRQTAERGGRERGKC